MDKVVYLRFILNRIERRWMNLRNFNHLYNWNHFHHYRALSVTTKWNNNQLDMAIRNVAIVAHVDHGKTTLVDALLKTQSDFTSNLEREMDNNDLEKERGITILSKSTSIKYKNNVINIVDTPGHTDFGGEVERVLSMVDGICLVVDATDGPMPQSKFVLTKALENNLKPVIVINKIDRNTRRIKEVENEIFDLFCSLNANDDQLNYKTLYAVGREGFASLSIPDNFDSFESNISPLLDVIIEEIPPPLIQQGGFRMLVTIMENDPSLHYGKLLLTGRILSGQCCTNQKISIISSDGKKVGESTILQLLKRSGTKRYEIKSAQAGDIVTIAGVTNARVTNTLCDISEECQGPISGPVLDPPTLSVFFSVNDSPLLGKPKVSGGNKFTLQQLQDRLNNEAIINISINVSSCILVGGRDCFEVQGRGEMQIGILVENMRREGYEFSVSPPKALIKLDEHGKKLEPIEEVTIDVAEQNVGSVIQSLMTRKGELIDSFPSEDGTRRRNIFKVPTRGIVGLRAELICSTHGDIVINSTFDSYEPWKGTLGEIRKGVIVSTTNGSSTKYALAAIEARGELFILPSQPMYEGLIIGECSRADDIDVNPVKEKKLTNIRAAGKDENIKLSPPRLLSFEDCIGYVQDDELIEVTPLAIRLRKAELNSSRRAQIRRRQRI